MFELVLSVIFPSFIRPSTVYQTMPEKSGAVIRKQASVFLAAMYTRMGTAAIYEDWTHLKIKYAFFHTRSDTTEVSC
jgi:hypothetical protein